MSFDPYQTASYQRFVESMAPECRCTHGPCDGVLAGGICDRQIDHKAEGFEDPDELKEKRADPWEERE